MDTKTKVDITGVMLIPITGWEKLLGESTKTTNFTVKITPKGEFWKTLSPEEQKRLAWKLNLVETYAAHMAGGMVKGTKKYMTDDVSLDQWMTHLIDEGCDLANYQLLLLNSFRQQSSKEDNNENNKE